MGDSHSFRVFGDPQPQGSKSAWLNKRTNKVIMSEANDKKLKPWRKTVESAAKEYAKKNCIEPINDPVRIRQEFWLTKPASKPKRDTLPETSFDVDKLARAVNDAITGSIITNDARIVVLYLVKRYATELTPPGVLIEVEKLPQGSAI